MKHIKTILLSAVAVLVSVMETQAQSMVESQPQQPQNDLAAVNTDSLRLAQTSMIMDSTMLGADIVPMIESRGNGIKVNQSSATAIALNGHKTLTSERKLSGYRIRIYFSNKQSARNESAQVEEKFKEHFPDVPVYRTYPNPHFKVAVGNFRTKSDALKALEEIRLYFPDAYILKEREMDFPAIK